MKRFFKWLRRDTSQRSIAGETDQDDVKVTPEQETEDEYRDDFSFNWKATDQIENSGPAKNTLDQCGCEATVPYPTLKLVDATLSEAEEDIGIDLHNTGRFDTANK